ncbi:class I SAM-dependent methyltransferase [Nesterenkonia sandarakina]|uniref:Demethylmenaquinone methyltransferase/2-methoxy-6-polyprenyl-1,4-benzoquinol methylase n=1 Tax=Nesterenkonia sandarakina TaxID=272918 RepID=A0A7Z0J3S0_9MICC|nr:class I SAM-dependent methyltransferase [Nesterenkonia sandarakina]NYJ17179.1 demethylmenaquinone methyltransferase/2-methoxy-6-polyprenyl-1,4-benzoquinol methylase [Nesterenkonia sandarakina]
MIELLELTAGEQVLDLGCGTGMNFPLLQDQVGPNGRIVGIDRSADMLAQARKKATRQGWDNVILIQADATALDPAEISAQITRAGGQALSDAALTTYALSLMQPWQDAWTHMRMLTAEQARLGVLDMQRPTGASSVLTPLARIACWMGGADIDAHPWTALERDCTDVRTASARGGHLQVRAGVKPSDAATSHN